MSWTTNMARVWSRRFPFIFRGVPAPMTPKQKSKARGKIEYSPIELQFWRAYIKMKPPALRGLVRQYNTGKGGVGGYRLDFAIPAQKFGIELDGFASHASTASIARDRMRERHLQMHGWYIVRFGGSEVFNGADECVRQAARLAELHMMGRT